MFKNKFTFLGVVMIVCSVGVVLAVFLFVQTVLFSAKNPSTTLATDRNPFAENSVNEGSENQSNGIESTVLTINDDDNVWGNKKAKVLLFLYDDFECPFCAGFYDTMEKVKIEFEGKIAIVFRHYPLAFHQKAFPAAIASECAAEQGKFWEMYGKLFENSKKNLLSTEQYKKDAAGLGLDLEKFNDCILQNKYKEKIAKQMLDGKDIGVKGTPAFFINGQFYSGAYPFEDTETDGKKTEGIKNMILKALNAK